MSPRQIELARHALGLPNERHQTYRNRFYASSGHRDFADWQAMVEAGMAVQSEPRKGSGMRMFGLTRQGASAALHAGETLDPEDFPS
jgi:hypothetical protein